MKSDLYWKTCIVLFITILINCKIFLESKKFQQGPPSCSGAPVCAFTTPGSVCEVVDEFFFVDEPTVTNDSCKEILLDNIISKRCELISMCAYLCHKMQSCVNFNVNMKSNSCQLFEYYPFVLYPKAACQNFEIVKEKTILFPKAKTNLALGKRSCMSSVYQSNYFKYGSWHAFDGNLGTDVDILHQCAHTNDDVYGSSWIAVDLEITVQVGVVKALNRDGTFPAFRMSDISAYVFNATSIVEIPPKSQQMWCGSYKGTPKPSQMVSINCSVGLPASRFVLLQQSQTYNFMAVCEMEVYAKE